MPKSEPWFKSSFCGANNSCLEVKRSPDVVQVRDNKDLEGPVLTFSAQAWNDFLATIHKH